MISLEDCIALCDLTREEVDAIAEHEHLSEIAATALADYLMRTKDGPAKVLQMIIDDIRNALERGDRDHAKELAHALRHFLREHPEAEQASA